MPTHFTDAQQTAIDKVQRGLLLTREDLAALRDVDPKFSAMVAGIAEAVAEALKEQDDRIAALEARVAQLEEKPSVKYCGVFEEGRSYMNGDAVTRQGSLWIARLNHLQSTPGVDFVGWQLAVKRGKDGKDAR